jgi:hypothetical protein
LLVAIAQKLGIVTERCTPLRGDGRAGVRYDAHVSLPLFVLSGIGGDERLFDAQRAVRDIRPISWILPADPREPLIDFASRLSRQLPINEPFDIGGSSFGGMIALELARHTSPRHVFLFGSCCSPDAIAPSLRALRRSPRSRLIACCIRHGCCNRLSRDGSAQRRQRTLICSHTCSQQLHQHSFGGRGVRLPRGPVLPSYRCRFNACTAIAII